MTASAEIEPSPAASAGEALLDADGTYLWTDALCSELLGATSDELTGSVSFAALPAGANEVWWVENDALPQGTVCQLVHQEGEPGPWKLRFFSGSAPRAVGFAHALLSRATETDLDAIVRDFTSQFAQQTALLGCAIVLMDVETGEPTFAGGDSARRGQLAAMEECRRNGAPMTIWQGRYENRVVVDRHWIENVMTDERFAPIRPFLHSEGDIRTHGFAAVPLRIDNVTFGVIAGAIEDPSSVSAEKVRLWTELAFEITLALQYSAAIRDARARGAERERQRLNEDLHDSVSQDLFALKLLAARAAQDVASIAEPGIRDEVREIRELTATIEANVRTLIGERRRIRSSASVTERLTALGREIALQGGLQVHIDVSHTWNDLGDDSADDVVRIVQEALRNIVKHARATTASVRLIADPASPDILLVEIVDDGVPFGPETAPLDRFGLASIRDRVSEQGGSLEIRTVPSKTMRVRLQPTFVSEWDAAQHDL